MKPPTTLIQHITHNGNGNIYANQNAGADGPAQKIDGRLFVAALAVAAVALVGSTLYGIMVGAVAFGMWIAPYVAGGLLAAGTGIGGFALYKRRVLAQPLPAIEDVPAVVIEAAPVAVPAQQPRLLRSPEVEELIAAYEDHVGRPMKEYEIDHMEKQMFPQPTAKVIPLCASLPESQPSQPSAALPLPMQSSL